jgi:zinc transporter, ZIP family
VSDEYSIIVLLAFLSVFSTLIGIGLALLCVKCFRGTKAIVFGISFSAGIMLLISALELFPESLREAGVSSSLLALVVGIFFFVLLNALLPHFHMSHEDGLAKNKIIRVAFLVALGLLIHDFPEGFAMANSYLVSPKLGILIALGITIHNIPEEFAIAIPLALAQKKKMMFIVGLLSALAEPAGAVVGIAAVHYFSYLNFFFLSFAAGAMIFISFHELIPVALRYKQLSSLAGGLAASALVYFFLVKFIAM